jgi:Protein of unknown function (DUF1657)
MHKKRLSFSQFTYEGGFTVTTYSKVKQTLVSLEGTKATLERYSMISEDQHARQAFRRNADKLQVVIDRLKKRVQTMEMEEPQYKGI